MWIESEDGNFVNLDFKRAIVVIDKLGEDGETTAVLINAIDSQAGEAPIILRSFQIGDGLVLSQARAAADSLMQGIRQAMADKSIFIRPTSRTWGVSTMYGMASKKGELREKV